MKKNLLVLGTLLFFLLTGCESSKTEGAAHNEKDDIAEYEEFVQDFESISAQNLNAKILEQDDFVLYVGRKTCPYCRIFVPKLHAASSNKDNNIFYLDVEEADSEDEIGTLLQALQVEFVPALLSFNGSNPKEVLDIDSEKITIEEIEDFLN